MKSMFSRLFSVTAVIIVVAVVGLGLSFRAMVSNYLAGERETALLANAQVVSELAATYTGLYSDGYSSAAMAFHMNLSFAAQVSGSDALVCTTDGQVMFCSCPELVCAHIGLQLDSSFVQQALQGQQFTSGVLTGIYNEKRYIAAQPCTQSDGTIIGLVVVSEPVQGVGELLTQITQMFIFVAVIVVMLTFVTVSIFTQGQCRPLRDMANAAREFGHGNLTARVNTGGDNTVEIDELAVAFNNMASSLEKSEYQRQEFVANVSHELKTPMTTIGGYVDGILDGTIPPESQRKYLALVSDEVKRLSRLVRSMLDVSRLQDQGGIPLEKMGRFDVAECLGQVLITFEQKINDKGLEVEVNFPEYPVYARGELDAITQVVYNLIDNAVKFAPQGGQLSLALQESGQKVYVSVANTGQTIPPEELPLVFDRFHKIDKSRSLNRDSWGLGLYIVKTIIGSHGEDISVTSRDGKTQFTFTLTKVNSL